MSMKGVLIKEYIKDISEIKVSYDLPIPDTFNDGDLLIKVMAVGMGFADYLQAQGKHQIKAGLPFILGIEAAGIVVKCSPDSRFKVGDRVFTFATQCLAQYCLISEISARPIPKSLSFEEAVAISINYPTNYLGLVDKGKLEKGQTVLIHGSTGAVGLSAVALAKALGARVIATGSCDDKLKYALEEGAEHVINIKKDTKWWETVLNFTHGRGVDIVYDPVGLINLSLKCIAFKGKAIIIGFAGGTIEKVPMNRVLLKNVNLEGVYLGTYITNDYPIYEKAWSHLEELFESNQLKALVNPKRFVMEDVQSVLRSIVARESVSKIVLSITHDDNKAHL